MCLRKFLKNATLSPLLAADLGQQAKALCVPVRLAAGMLCTGRAKHAYEQFFPSTWQHALKYLQLSHAYASLLLDTHHFCWICFVCRDNILEAVKRFKEVYGKK
jgi:hypothetical protein